MIPVSLTHLYFKVALVSERYKKWNAVDSVYGELRGFSHMSAAFRVCFVCQFWSIFPPYPLSLSQFIRTLSTIFWCHTLLFSPTMELGCMQWHVRTLHVHLHTQYMYNRPSLSLQLILSFDSPVIDQRKAVPVRLILWECCLWIHVVWSVFLLSWKRQMSSISFKQHHFTYWNGVVSRTIYIHMFFNFDLILFALIQLLEYT